MECEVAVIELEFRRADRILRRDDVRVGKVIFDDVIHEVIGLVNDAVSKAMDRLNLEISCTAIIHVGREGI